MSLGETIRTLRSGKNMSQSDLAQSLDVSRQSVSKWETDSAVPDLDKLVHMSELFGVTLDALVKSQAPPQPASAPAQAAHQAAPDAPASMPNAHHIIGVILLCFGGLIALLLLLLGGGASGLLFASPLLLCGVICLKARRRTGLWCGWAVYLCVDFYLRYATGITWRIVLTTPHFTPEMNYARLAIGWVQLFWMLLLLFLTLRAFRGCTASLGRGERSLLVLGLAALVGLTVGQQAVLYDWHSLPYQQVNHMWYIWLRFFGDNLRFALLTALLVKAAALLRHRRTVKGA